MAGGYQPVTVGSFLKGLPDLHFSLDKSVYDTCQAAPAVGGGDKR